MAASTSTEEQLEKLKQFLGLYQLAQAEPDWSIGSIPQGFLDPNYVPSKSNMAIVIVSVISMSLAVTVVASRMMVRFRGGFKASAVTLDDILIAISTIIAIGFTGIQIAVYFATGGGKHAYDSTFNELSAVLKFAYAHLFTYIVLAWLIRMSVVFMFLRNVPKERKSLTWVLRSLLVWFTAFFITNLGTTLFSCKPIPAAWSLGMRLNGFKCVNVAQEVLALGIIGVFNDAVLLLLPFIIFWEMEMSRRLRVTSWCNLALGAFVSGCAIARTFYIYHAYRSYDVTWNAMSLLLWGQLEVACGIMAASLPSLNDVFMRIHRRHLSNTRTARWFDRRILSSKSSTSDLNEDWFEKTNGTADYTENRPSPPIKFLSAPAEYNITDDGYVDRNEEWLMTGKKTQAEPRSTPSISSSVGAGGYQAFPPPPPPPLDSSVPSLPHPPGSAVLQGAAPFITSNWVTSNPTTTTIVALNQLGSDELPYAESIISSIRSARRSEKRRGSLLTRNHSTLSFNTPSVREEFEQEEREQALLTQRSYSSQSGRLPSSRRAKRKPRTSISPSRSALRTDYGQTDLSLPSPVTERSLPRIQPLFVNEKKAKHLRVSAVPSSRYSQQSSATMQPLIEDASFSRHNRESQESMESTRIPADRESINSLDLPIQVPGHSLPESRQ